jgi:hypothetical protein
MSGRRWFDNAGRIPAALNERGKRCFVQLLNGRQPEESWEATSLIWRLDGHPFSIVKWASDAQGG